MLLVPTCPHASRRVAGAPVSTCSSVCPPRRAWIPSPGWAAASAYSHGKSALRECIPGGRFGPCLSLCQRPRSYGKIEPRRIVVAYFSGTWENRIRRHCVKSTPWRNVREMSTRWPAKFGRVWQNLARCWATLAGVSQRRGNSRRPRSSWPRLAGGCISVWRPLWPRTERLSSVSPPLRLRPDSQEIHFQQTI